MIYLYQTSHFVVQQTDEKMLRQQLKAEGVEARRLSKFTQLALLGVLPLRPYLTENTAIYLGSSFSSPSKFSKMFEQLNQHHIPSPLDFMANLNNAAVFQLAQMLGIKGNSLFLALDQQNTDQLWQLANLDLTQHYCEQALVGWAYESPNGEEEGSFWCLVGTDPAQSIATFPIKSAHSELSQGFFVQQQQWYQSLTMKIKE